MTAVEAEIAAGTQEPMGFRDPLVRIAPDARAVLANDEIGGGVGQGRRLGIAFEERELDAMLVLEAARGGPAAPG